MINNSVILFLEKEHVKMSVISKQSSRSAKRYHGLQVSKNSDITDTHDIPQYEELSSDEFYSSPGYIPHFENNIDSEFEVSDIDDLTQTSLQLNTEQSDEIENNETLLNVQRAKKQPKNQNKLVRDKRVYCLYCELLVSNFPRHLERQHALEEDVRSFITQPKKSQERLKCLELIKNKGNLYYNRKVLEQKQGSIIVGRRPKSHDKVDTNDYLPCKHCFKFFKKKKLYRHANRCIFQESLCSETAGLPKKRNKIMQSAMLLQTTSDFKKLHEEVFSSMKSDEVSFVAQNDNLICSFGARLLQNHRQHHLVGYISQRMRQLSKFLTVLRSMVPDLTDFKDFFEPKHYKTVVDAANQLSGYDEEKNTYLYPSVAMKIGHSILQCADILESQIIIEDSNQEKLQKVKNFIKFFKRNGSILCHLIPDKI